MPGGWDTDVKKFFARILNSISWALLWMIACATAGLYFELGYTNGKPLVYTIIFYTCAVASLLLLIRYLYKSWSKEEEG